MKSKFELPEAIFSVTKSFPNKARPPVTDTAHRPVDELPSRTVSEVIDIAFIKKELSSQNVTEIAKWTAVVAIVTIAVSAIY